MSAGQGKSEQELMELLKEFDTPSVTNVLGTYPKKKDVCLGLYNPWHTNWYTDQSMKCIYPELGRRAGHVVTAVFGMPDPDFGRLDFTDILRAVWACDNPVIVVFKQDIPENIRMKNGLAGGNMVTALKRAGAVGLISDGPSRDVDEIREMDFQYMLTGVSAGHGAFSIKAVNVPVSICGMDVCPGEIIHMDENGAVKFPRQHLADVYERLCLLREQENKKMSSLAAAADVEGLVKAWLG
ncbi:MAG: RraA family protein [Methylobacteriaceae bacterium]|jgi:regulator of RNase E activity RraA|nr:RraA family protein [Methylobacteriaceae bacterium]